MRNFNLEAALDSVGGDSEILRDASRVFLDTLPDTVEGIQRALDTDNPTLLHALSHSLKGSLLIFGAEDARCLAAELERRGRGGEAMACQEMFESLKKSLLDLKTELEIWVRT
jgi:HPt (histidine-containing phosphotransfer) domain-containing protein